MPEARVLFLLRRYVDEPLLNPHRMAVAFLKQSALVVAPMLVTLLISSLIFATFAIDAKSTEGRIIEGALLLLLIVTLFLSAPRYRVAKKMLRNLAVCFLALYFALLGFGPPAEISDVTIGAVLYSIPLVAYVLCCFRIRRGEQPSVLVS